MKYLFGILSILLSLSSCTSGSSGAIDINADQVESMLQSDRSIQLVDLRTPLELQTTGFIDGAQNINFNGPDFSAQISKLDKNKPLMVYCAAGGRSGRAAPQLVKMGFAKVYNYTGGMNDWKSKGKKTVQ
ncbi:MAG: rhodanese-like domain-containing protein [Bacteroidota bacterium]